MRTLSPRTAVDTLTWQIEQAFNSDPLMNPGACICHYTSWR
jgi:hypothetical protein